MDTSLIEIEYDEISRKKLLVTNWIKMLFNRNLLENSLEDNINYAISKLDDFDTTYIKGKARKYMLKIIFQKLNTIRNVPDIEDFLDKNKQEYKFFIINKISYPKIYKKLEKENTEVFSDIELMDNVVDNILVPQHIILTDEEANMYMKEYKLSKVNMMKIYSSDRIARYYNIKPGQIVKIIRPSITAGYEIALRICIQAKIN